MENIQKIEVNIQSNKAYLLSRKIMNFLKRSVLRYFVASTLFGVIYPYILGSMLLSVFVYFISLCFLSLTVIYISSTIQSKNRKFDANVTFQKDKITVKHLNKNLVEEKDWNWISKSSKDEKAFYFEVLNGKYGEMLVVPLKSISNLEAETLSTWLKQGVL